MLSRQQWQAFKLPQCMKIAKKVSFKKKLCIMAKRHIIGKMEELWYNFSINKCSFFFFTRLYSSSRMVATTNNHIWHQCHTFSYPRRHFVRWCHQQKRCLLRQEGNFFTGWLKCAIDPVKMPYFSKSSLHFRFCLLWLPILLATIWRTYLVRRCDEAKEFCLKHPVTREKLPHL